MLMVKHLLRLNRFSPLMQIISLTKRLSDCCILQSKQPDVFCSESFYIQWKQLIELININSNKVLCFVEFLAWKQEEERATVSCFTKKGRQLIKDVQRYSCRQTGIYKSRGTQKRHLKIQGSCKTGLKCPAGITAISSARGWCYIVYNSQLYKHTYVRTYIHTYIRQMDCLLPIIFRSRC